MDLATVYNKHFEFLKHIFYKRIDFLPVDTL